MKASAYSKDLLDCSCKKLPPPIKKLGIYKNDQIPQGKNLFYNEALCLLGNIVDYFYFWSGFNVIGKYSCFVALPVLPVYI